MLLDENGDSVIAHAMDSGNMRSLQFLLICLFVFVRF